MRRLIGIGASMGGIDALESLLSRIPPEVPPLLIVQHILPAFTRRLAERLSSVGAIHVVLARHGAPLEPGVAYLAPPYCHLLVRSVSGQLQTRLSASPPVGFHRPSIDVLFHSLAELTSVQTIALLLSGMGGDGAEGLLALRLKGAHTIVQDEASSLIFGIPKRAIALGAAERVAPLDELPSAILDCLGPGATSRAGYLRSRARTARS